MAISTWVKGNSILLQSRGAIKNEGMSWGLIQETRVQYTKCVRYRVEQQQQEEHDETGEKILF